MKIKLKYVFIILFLLFSLISQSQNPHSFYSFKGFHVGLSGQAEFIQKCSFVAIDGSDPAPRPKWTYGWETGIEFSYHFAKYFGVSLGISYGTQHSYDYDIYISKEPDFKGGWINQNEYEGFFYIFSHKEFIFPILKLEFHYPLNKYLFFTAEAGIKVKGINDRISYGKDGYGEYGRSVGYLVDPLYYPGSYPGEIVYYNDLGFQDMGKISCNLLLGLGLYYKLPYGDLLRFTAGINMSFSNIIEGVYIYHLTGSYGTFTVRNDYIYTQLSYIHTLNWQKAKKYLKKQEYYFDSKKERSGKILELLKN